MRQASPELRAQKSSCPHNNMPTPINLQRSFPQKLDLKQYNIDMENIFRAISILESYVTTSPANVWTTATRPASPTVGVSGYNTDFSGEEVYTSAGWLVKNGVWSYATRPNTTGLAAGSQGFNTDIPGRDLWTGTEWNNA